MRSRVGSNVCYDEAGGPPYYADRNKFWTPTNPIDEWARDYYPTSKDIHGKYREHHRETSFLWGSPIGHDTFNGLTKPLAEAIQVSMLVTDHIKEKSRWLWGKHDLQLITDVANREKERKWAAEEKERADAAKKRKRNTEEGQGGGPKKKTTKKR